MSRIHSSLLQISPRQRSFAAAGFSLVELLIVLSILAVLAALVVPRLSSASSVAKYSALRDDVRSLRTQIMLYRTQHQGVSPGYPNGNTAAAPTYDDFVNQLTQYTNAKGQTSTQKDAQYHFGPYLLKVPANTVSSNSDVLFIADNQNFPAVSSGNAGWVYKPATGQIAANVAGTDEEGTNLFDY